MVKMLLFLNNKNYYTSNSREKSFSKEHLNIPLPNKIRFKNFDERSKLTKIQNYSQYRVLETSFVFEFA